MLVVRTPVTLALAAIAVALAATSAGASSKADAAGATARAFAIKVVVPGQSGAVGAAVSAPPDGAALGQSFAYPGDGSVATTAGLTASAQTDVGTTASGTASADITSLSLFGGEITASSVSARARSNATGKGGSGDVGGSTVKNLVVLGQSVAVGTNTHVTLGDWGYATTLESATSKTHSSSQRGFRGFVAALDVHLTAAHANLPAGTEIIVGYAETAAQASVQSTTTGGSTTTKDTTPTITTGGGASKPATHGKKKLPKAPEQKQTGANSGTGGVRLPPPGLHPTLTAGRYVFPVYGPVAYSDTFGSPRADTIWHHGDDLFAPLGAPILAVADGTVFSVGWNDVGGNRFWLRDRQGNEFYFAHLSAFSPYAKNGRQVKAGTVLGFVGNTGDAEGTPYHLHFEIHPVSLLYLAYDGAVDPTPYLVAWQHLHDVAFSAAAGWVPPAHVTDPAPKPGAVLLQVSDISGASGLDPGSLQRAFSASVSSEGDLTLLRSAGALPRG
jgi:murein DD-endopeptidase MepM/ murein hydrolase activator NlpD